MKQENVMKETRNSPYYKLHIKLINLDKLLLVSEVDDKTILSITETINRVTADLKTMMED